MELEKLLEETKSKAIFLLKDNGETIDFYPKENNLGDLQDKITVFKATIFNMSNHFFSNYFKTNLKEIILKSDNENILIIKHNEYILCFLSDKNINIGLLELILKKEFNY
ncbi:hypothetical protein RRF68_08915 [Tenacibaculum sp. HL-MS23]|uniref:hypothetical protein n=1 Tax=unclassified Tenacibaculum TaxID=2635139 RepID=UPI001C4E57F8|nr:MULTISPECIES: hypothetical protein [unclassified Tenacibaculum]QXP73071.1 hypothetical protein H0I30_10325 [Tenacibaculum sp. AHE14PA]QXP76985.1 hypothetical protein H0I31_05065 [Tenacibaculum sp. AHE15PA]WNW01117.1 hypothetical protein RRF68_08915 [Tenacibaculum sp. HL-MS23]